MGPKRLRTYTETSMLAALADVNRGMAYKTAARKHNVPRVTLMDKHKGKVPIKAKMGPTSVFSPEQESALVEWVKCMAKAGFPVSTETFLNSAGKLSQELNLKFGENAKPGRKWLALFLKRHPEVSLRQSQNLTVMRRNVTQEKINGWFQEVENYLNAESLREVLDDPSRVFNTDETAFFLNPKPGKVLAEKGCKNVYTASGNDEKFNLTVLITANAEGKMAPPMVVYRYNRIPQIIAESVPSEWAIGKSENGWMTHELFYMYMANIFLPWVKSQNIQLPIVFFMDGHTSHISYPLSQFCREEGVVLVALYPNATHILQPMDVAVFHSLKSEWRQKVQEWRIQNAGEQLKKHNFAPLLEQTLKCISITTLQNGFRKCGLVPWNPTQVKVADDAKLETKCSQEDEIFLTTLEKHIGPENVLLFNQTRGAWQGPVKHESLFNLWKKVKGKHRDEKVKDLPPLPVDENGSSVREEIQAEEQPTLASEEDVASTSKCILVGRLRPLKENVASQEISSPVNIKSMPVDPTSLRTKTVVSKDLIPVASTSKGHGHASPLRKCDATSPDPQLPSPFKRVLQWPEAKENMQSKRRKEKLPAVVTSPQMIEYYKKKEKQKEEAEKQKEERKKRREIKKQEIEARKTLIMGKKKNTEMSSDSDSETQISLQESSSDWDEVRDDDEELIEVPSIKELKEGDFILVEFKGGKRMATNFTYLCVVQKVISTEEIEIMGLKSSDRTKKVFVVNEKDISLISFTQVMGKVKQPSVIVTGERVSYEFKHPLQVKEM